jgi:hypothetical protein
MTSIILYTSHQQFAQGGKRVRRNDRRTAHGENISKARGYRGTCPISRAVSMGRLNTNSKSICEGSTAKSHSRALIQTDHHPGWA